MQNILRRPERANRTATLLLLAACLVCYANGLTGNFTYDDKAIVRDDARIHSPAGIRDIFTTPYFGGPRGLGTGYRPVLLVSFAVQWWIHDGEHRFSSVRVLLLSLSGCHVRAAACGREWGSAAGANRGEAVLIPRASCELVCTEFPDQVAPNVRLG